MSDTARWIAVDWGTSNLRAWLMDGEAVVDQGASTAGMAGLSREDFEPALLALVDRWLPPERTTLVVACGMVGARQGWCEAPYVRAPAQPLDPRACVEAPSRDPRLSVRIVHGLRQDAPADVMRGEETQLGGLLHGEPGFEGIACLPGTHSKWALLRDGRVETFTTFMTGELFALLDRQSILRHSTGEGGDDPDAFEEGVAAMLSHPDELTASLFAIRAASLLHDAKPSAARSRLSGLLIGAEIAASRKRFGNEPVTIIGSDALAQLYARALQMSGRRATLRDATALTLAGLTAARSMIQSSGS